MHHGQDPKMNVKVVRSFKDALSRQIYEGVKIRRAANVMNTKLEASITSANVLECVSASRCSQCGEGIMMSVIMKS